MAKKKATQSTQKNTGEFQLPVEESRVLAGWPMPEFEKFSRGKRWYWIAGVIVVLILVYAIIDANFLFAFLTILLALIVVFHEIKQPREIYFTTTDSEITIGESIIPHSDISRFWVAHIDGQAVLYFDFKNIFRPRVMVPLPTDIAQGVVDLLSAMLEHDLGADQMPTADAWARRFKF